MRAAFLNRHKAYVKVLDSCNVFGLDKIDFASKTHQLCSYHTYIVVQLSGVWMCGCV